MVVLKKANVFLVYVESTRKNKMRTKISNMPGNPIFAEDVLLHNRFILDEESINVNPDFFQVKISDYMVVFCSSLVPHSPNQIKFIFQIKSKIGNQFVLKQVHKLARGYTADHIKSLVEEGKLSQELSHCYKADLKICMIKFSDLELLINYDPLIRTYHSSSWKM
ncbi:MAG: hypothetical protein FK730_15240 [Asgard group archaeon]|nr:hypothetical protein [Asgard group archaeon]